MLHILSELPAAASDEDIKNTILTNYSDIPSTTEAVTRLQNMQTSPTEPLVTFNHRYEAIHRVAFSLSPNEQHNKTIIMEYAKKLPQNTRDKLLRKIAKKNSYIRTLEDAFKQAIEINRETSFVEAASGRYSEQNNTRITRVKSVNAGSPSGELYWYMISWVTSNIHELITKIKAPVPEVEHFI